MWRKAERPGRKRGRLGGRGANCGEGVEGTFGPAQTGSGGAGGLSICCGNRNPRRDCVWGLPEPGAGPGGLGLRDLWGQYHTQEPGWQEVHMRTHLGSP